MVPLFIIRMVLPKSQIPDSLKIRQAFMEEHWLPMEVPYYLKIVYLMIIRL